MELHKQDDLLKKILPKQKKVCGVVYVPSQYTLSFSHNEKRYVFNTLTKQCVEAVLPKSCSVGEGFDDLIEDYFLLPEGKDEIAFYQSISSILRTYACKKGEKKYTIFTTLFCNARCIYCYEKGVKPTSMLPETAEQTVRYILSSRSKDTVKLTWFGGEPLLQKDVIDYISNALQNEEVPYKSFIISNGSLITSSEIEKMTGLWKTDRIQISMDGVEKDYIARKRYCKSGDQYHHVIRMIDQIAAQRIRVQIRCNLDEKNIAGLPSFLEDLNQGIVHKEKVFVYLAPLYAVRAGDNDFSFWREMIKARSLLEQAGFRSENSFSSNFSFRANHCMADGNGVVIAPDGSLYSCEHCPPESRFGDVWHGVTDEAARREFGRTDRVREKCRKCPFLPDCTAFASCPIQDKHCREVREMMALDALKRLVQNHEKEEAADGEVPAC